ncbi:MAG: phage tail protein [Alphaproteobacteria bacterium]|nr:phage tail protein [Alphaproteobacteria bacterium]MBV9371120.1 phage tail protein [Alphaproteobacteria bacterium]MBV9900772.1 phage tail protein [Alphaproteobacteria bacterium]
MATLVLSTAGQALGGPIGAALGALVGQQIDQRLFAPKPRQGPRLGDLAVQTSHYGSDIARLFGRMRVAGTVIWATDLKERRATGGGGKGQAKTVSYSYSVSFAVALSGRPIRSVGRIWADGKLLRGEAGDFKTPTGFRLHEGDEAQAPDPLIVAAEGAGGAPAYRGLAYAVFEDFELADYGNRIPSLSFEVEADEGPVPVAAIVAALSGGEVAAGPSPALAGYAATGESLRAAVEGLVATAGLTLRDGPAGLIVSQPGGEAETTLGADEAGASADASPRRTQTRRKGAAALPAEVTLSYYDPDRDFQAGLQRAHRGGPASRAERAVLPAAIGAVQAKAMAEARLKRLWAGRETMRLSLPWRRAGLRPGAVIALEGRRGLWRVAAAALEHMALTLELEAQPGAAAGLVAADPGRAAPSPDRLLGETRLVIVDAPLADDLPTRPRLAVLAAGTGEGWRRADLTASWDGGASWQAAGGTAPAAVIGAAQVVPGTAGSTLLDLGGAIEVTLLSDEAWLESRSDAALAAGANLAVLGDELLQFGTAVPLGARRFRLSRLLRGRRGTEWASGTHLPGEAFGLIDPAALVMIEPPLAAIGAEAVVLASGGGEAARRRIGGEAVRPPSPVHLTAVRRADGDVAIGWTRRSRSGWTWIDGADAPLGEERQLYRVTLATATSRRVAETAAPAFVYAAADIAADGAAGTLAIEIVQLGTGAASRPATLSLGLD